jgi:hypothetical protein
LVAALTRETSPTKATFCLAQIAIKPSRASSAAPAFSPKTALEHLSSQATAPIVAIQQSMLERFKFQPLAGSAAVVTRETSLIQGALFLDQIATKHSLAFSVAQVS